MKKTMKRIFAIIAVLALCLSLAACGNSGGRNSGKGGSDGNTRRLADRAQLFKLAPGIVALLSGIFDLVTEVIRLLFRVIKAVFRFVQSIVVLLKFPLHTR